METKVNYAQLQLTVFDVMGREIQTIQSTSNQIVLPRNNLVQGVYFYRIEGDGQVLDTGKLIVQ